MSSVRDELNDEKMCSFSEHEVSDSCSYYGDDACGDGLLAITQSAILSGF